MIQSFILVDEKEGASPYTIINVHPPRNSIVASGLIHNPDELRTLQLNFNNAKVKIDAVMFPTNLHSAAEHYKWQLIKFKNSDFPYIEMMNQLAKR